MSVKDQSQILPRWLSLRQAASYGPYGQKRLVELIRDRKIRGCHLADNGKRPWVIDRLSLDEYVDGQMDDGIDRNKILDFVSRVK